MIDLDDSPWDAWRPEDAQRRLAELDLPWYVAAGWAIDLFLGGERREHEDLELAVPNARIGELVAALPDLDAFVIGTRTLERRRRSPRSTRPRSPPPTRRGSATAPRAPGSSTSSASPPTATPGSAAATTGSGCRTQS